MSKLFYSRYSVVYSFIVLFISSSFFVRLALLIWSLTKASFSLAALATIFIKGFVYDAGVAVFFCLIYCLYLLVIPQRWNKSVTNKTITYIGFSLVLLIIMFSFFAEFVFWDEFESRFNFIAVDYLIYTYEVIHNINESYPLPLLIGGMLLAVLSVTWVFHKKKIFERSFSTHTPFLKRLLITCFFFLVAAFYFFVIKNSWADNSPARYRNELSKAGIYSFFAAFKGNELNYEDFYKQIDNKKAFNLTRYNLQDSNTSFSENQFSIRRSIASNTAQQFPNVILITIESLSADFLNYFGNTGYLTPVMDSLARNSIFFTDLYATGNRTVRGMEALTLSIPPTPGNSIVRRDNNDNLFTTGSVFKKQGYDCSFFYGGDGYFDNMNKFFGNNGFDVTDRGKRLLPADNFTSRHNYIADSSVHFENAWGVCDEDLYDAVIRDADRKYQIHKNFYDFVMTTSNHRPYTFPSGKIDIPSGSGREGAVKYTDFAIGKFLNEISSRPWFQNTVIILVADHCANSAGKNEVDISKYHIPCMILNLHTTMNGRIDKMCSQIDIFPTLFNLLGWNYESNFFGQNILSLDYKPRIYSGTYQKLAYMKDDSLIILGPQRSIQTFIYDKKTNSQISTVLDLPVDEAIAAYQTAYYLFKKGGLKQ